MRSWNASTFVFISANTRHEPGCVEERWLPVMRALSEHGAAVRFLVLPGSRVGELARAQGIAVDPYILDEWNVIRSHSRLRKYLRRYLPVAAHSTGLEADLMLRWAARKVPEVEVVHTLAGTFGQTRRKRPVEALMRRFDELGMRSAACVIVVDDLAAEEVREAGVVQDRIRIEPGGGSSASIKAHLDLYRALMARRGAAR